MIAHNPLHGSGQAALPHPALALGEYVHATQRIGMTDGRQRQPAMDETPHAVPQDTAILAAPRQRAMPEPRLNTRPARSPVNASTLLLRTAPHDSGPMRVAISQSYDFCIHYTSPV
jgi:hypothetical protein